MSVPGHSCVKRNVEVNNLAKLGAKATPIGPTPIVKLYDRYIKYKLKDWTAEAAHWEIDETGKI